MSYSPHEAQAVAVFELTVVTMGAIPPGDRTHIARQCVENANAEHADALGGAATAQAVAAAFPSIPAPGGDGTTTAYSAPTMTNGTGRTMRGDVVFAIDSASGVIDPAATGTPYVTPNLADLNALAMKWARVAGVVHAGTHESGVDTTITVATRGMLPIVYNGFNVAPAGSPLLAGLPLRTLRALTNAVDVYSPGNAFGKDGDRRPVATLFAARPSECGLYGTDFVDMPGTFVDDSELSRTFFRRAIEALDAAHHAARDAAIVNRQQTLRALVAAAERAWRGGAIGGAGGQVRVTKGADFTVDKGMLDVALEVMFARMVNPTPRAVNHLIARIVRNAAYAAWVARGNALTVGLNVGGTVHPGGHSKLLVWPA